MGTHDKCFKILKNTGFIFFSILSLVILSISLFLLVIYSLNLSEEQRVLSEYRTETCTITSCYVYDIEWCYDNQICYKYNFTYTLRVNNLNYSSFQPKRVSFDY